MFVSSLPRYRPDLSDEFRVRSDISGHSVSGDFPFFILEDFPLLTTLDVSYNNFSGAFPSAVWERETQFNDLRITNNRFSGTFPAPPYEIRILKIASNQFQGEIPLPVDSATQTIFWDLQNNYFSRLRSTAGILPGSSIDISDNLLSCPEPGLVDLLGVVGDFTRNLCDVGGVESEYPTNVIESACTTVFPLLTSPCRRFVVQRCTQSCKRVNTVDLTIEFSGQLPTQRGIYTQFLVTVGSSKFDCLNTTKYVLPDSHERIADTHLVQG